MKKNWTCTVCSNSYSSFANEYQDTRRASRHFLLPAGEHLLVEASEIPEVYVLNDGWAFRFLQLPNGRRQIFNFLLPGDILSGGSIYNELQHSTVKALTSIQVCCRPRDDFEMELKANSSAATNPIAGGISVLKTLDEMIIVLGRFPAERRIAYLLLHLMKRISVRNETSDSRYPLPLRRRHIADAMGLTIEHVSRTLTVFRDHRILDLSKGILTVRNMHELERLGLIC
jgi:CRP-like cAMP-binding protein